MSLYTILPIAEQDLDNCATHIAKDNLDAALRLYEAAEETYQNLAEFPDMGEIYPSSNNLLLDIHFFPIKGFRRYLVFYQSTSGGIEIIRVISKSRNIRNILKY